MSVNVRDYGAVGDGFTDDTQAIQRAVNEATKVVIPPGIYRTTAVITLPAGCSLHAENIELRFDPIS